MKGLKKAFCLAAAGALLTVAAAGTAFAGEIYVSGAASLTNAFDKMKEAFEAKNPDIKVLTNYAASNPLLKQMQEGAPVDVFASADQATMDKAQAAKLIDPATRKNFALNDLVLIIPSDGNEMVKDIFALDTAMVKRIAIGNPDSVPAGRYTRDALKT
ncbi:MAG: molybdate ABC transporter substrate-binding protein, partial [Desulfovibrionaceae bacterium]|nr:molybdate ABC transporter substrate-binding protein [Desulfovibrionaceae bacterium]